MGRLIITLQQSKLFQILMTLIVMDVIFGCIRAVKEKSFNSSVGINGMLRKFGMLVSCLCMVYIDGIITFNLIGFIPETIRSCLPAETVGIMEFFAILYIIYEILSVLKNMTLSGLPVNRIWKTVSQFLKENTSEITDIDEEEEGKEDEGNAEEL